MPPLDEGALLYMPSTLPGISDQRGAAPAAGDGPHDQAASRKCDRVLGKAGRAETSTDPAPLSMMETVVMLKPQDQWRKVPTWYSSWAPEWAEAAPPPHHAGPHLARTSWLTR